MKKLLFTLVLFIGLGTASVSATIVSNLTTSKMMVLSQEFTPIELKDLPEAIQKTIAEKYVETTIKAAYVEIKEDGTKIYKVILIDKESKEFEVLFNEKGEVMEPVKS